MNPKIKEILLDMAHLVHQAIITDDDLIAQQALGDIAAALDSVLPLDGSEKVEREGGGGQRMDDNSSVHLDSPPPPSSRCTFQLAATVARQMDDDDLALRMENS